MSETLFWVGVLLLGCVWPWVGMAMTCIMGVACVVGAWWILMNVDAQFHDL